MMLMPGFPALSIIHPQLEHNGQTMERQIITPSLQYRKHPQVHQNQHNQLSTVFPCVASTALTKTTELEMEGGREEGGSEEERGHPCTH